MAYYLFVCVCLSVASLNLNYRRWILYIDNRYSPNKVFLMEIKVSNLVTLLKIASYDVVTYLGVVFQKLFLLTFLLSIKEDNESGLLDIFDFLSGTAEQIFAKLDWKQVLNVPYKLCIFSG